MQARGVPFRLIGLALWLTGIVIVLANSASHPVTHESQSDSVTDERYWLSAAYDLYCADLASEARDVAKRLRADATPQDVALAFEILWDGDCGAPLLDADCKDVECRALKLDELAAVAEAVPATDPESKAASLQLICSRVRRRAQRILEATAAADSPTGVRFAASGATSLRPRSCSRRPLDLEVVQMCFEMGDAECFASMMRPLDADLGERGF